MKFNIFSWYLLIICIAFYRNIRSFAHLLTGLFIFLLWSCKSFFYIFWGKVPYQVNVWFANILYHSVTCSFTFLVVIFAAQKLLILIKSNLSKNKTTTTNKLKHNLKVQNRVFLIGKQSSNLQGLQCLPYVAPPLSYTVPKITVKKKRTWRLCRKDLCGPGPEMEIPLQPRSHSHGLSLTAKKCSPWGGKWV